MTDIECVCTPWLINQLHWNLHCSPGIYGGLAFHTCSSTLSTYFNNFYVVCLFCRKTRSVSIMWRINFKLYRQFTQVQHVWLGKLRCYKLIWCWVHKNLLAAIWSHPEKSQWSFLFVLAVLLLCYNDRNRRRPFKYQINSKLNFLAVQATLRITCN